LTRAIYVTTDDKNFVKYKLTQQRRMQLWPHKLDWWWSHRNVNSRKTAVPPVIEMRLVSERMFVERLLFLGTSHLITDN